MTKKYTDKHIKKLYLGSSKAAQALWKIYEDSGEKVSIVYFDTVEEEHEVEVKVEVIKRRKNDNS